MTPEAQEAIITGLAEGKSLRAVCREANMPHISTVMRFVAADETFREQYARARAAGDDAMAEDIQDIADTEGDPQRARVRIDARKWLLGKRQPKKYGDKVDVEHSGDVIARLVWQPPE